jgi:MFS family permease
MVTDTAAAPIGDRLDVSRIQRRTLRLLFVTQIIGGVGITIGITVGVLLAARLGGTGVSGLAQSAAVVGGALLVVPVTRIIHARGRRPGLVVAYLAGAVGGAIVVVAAVTGWVPLLFLGMLLFGGGTAASLQARYAAVDLADPARRGRQLSAIVWATTIGAVTAPNLASLADTAVTGLDLPRYAGPFVFSVAAFVLAAAVLLILLRPDPLLTARAGAVTGLPAGIATAADPGAPVVRPHGGILAGLRVVAGRPAARLGVAAVAVGHLVMVGVMSMTPLHLGESHAEETVLRVVGLVLSVHIAGMYALSPIVGWLTDRYGRRAVILGGVGLLLAACALAGTAGHDTSRLAVGLFLLGLGWSGTMVAGSTLLSESVPVEARPSVQGLSDFTMGLAGAAAGALSGFIVQFAGYPVLNALAAIAVVPLVGLALRPVPVPVPVADGEERSDGAAD